MKNVDAATCWIGKKKVVNVDCSLMYLETNQYPWPRQRSVLFKDNGQNTVTFYFGAEDSG
jgi:hypothetical protein